MGGKSDSSSSSYLPPLGVGGTLSATLRALRRLLASSATGGALLYYRALGLLIGAGGAAAADGTLSITDDRTGRRYTVPVRNNAVRALDFLQITSAGLGAGVADHYDGSLRVLDRGFWNTACTETSITYIDGKVGYMQYRDKPIDELFHNNDYEEVMHLLIWGTLPTPEQKTSLRRRLASHMKAPQPVRDAIKAFPPDGLTHPMLLAGIAAFAALDEGTRAVHASGKPAYLGRADATDDGIVRTLAALATTVALVYCHKRGRDWTPPSDGRDESYIGNVLLMMGLTEEEEVEEVNEDDEGEKKKRKQPNRKLERCLQRLWVLNADHGMTNSTAVFLTAASTLQDPLSCTAAAVAAAYGPLHGGAVEMAYREFERVGDVSRVPALMADVRAKKFRLFGYGHRIYKVQDPRGTLVRRLLDEHRADVERNALLRVAMEIDRVAEHDPYFVKRNLKANADLYGCFLYTAMGLETDIILALSCLSRSPGVMAHWRESMSQPPMLWRPQHVFNGTVAQPKK
ncbi:citrate synthase [Xylariaceae sp. FL0804]|nr:citrate synthase [Xylariaceae sp. FL0804]